MSNKQAAYERPRNKAERVPDPTPKEIVARCLEIQTRWSEAERIERTNPESAKADESKQ